ncbi:hypothetical protein DMP17_22085 [Pseudonocardia sp. TMWB2A]|uniref:hypothetical protein n=1 Tax=Pseudonocardia sp. TMWB2A TaxID=687430 RepID=UPI00307D1A6C
MTGMGRLRSLRRRVERAVASAEELGRLRDELAEVRAELAAVRAAYARDAALFVAHRAAWERERARLVAGLPGVPVVADTRAAEQALLELRDNLINLDERRAR